MTEEKPPHYWVRGRKDYPAPESMEEEELEDIVYPRVTGEFDTVRQLVKGRSIARFGDGELKMMDGFSYIRQDASETLTAELQHVARNKYRKCLIGIPTMDKKGAKYKNWNRHRARFCKYFRRGSGQKFYSSLITRPDSSPWIECQEYVGLLTDVWRNKDKVVVVAENKSKLLTAVSRTNKAIHIECPSHGAYDVIDKLESAVVKEQPDIALLSCGVTATCLAFRLAWRGIQAIDLGSVGGFLLRWQAGGPPPENYADERANDE